MDGLYDDFKFVFENMREDDGTQRLNKYIAAAFISRFMLFEGTYQHYHSLDAARAKKYLEFAVEAAEVVMNSGLYQFDSDFKSLFRSEEHTSELQSLMRISYAVFCLKKKKQHMTTKKQQN